MALDPKTTAMGGAAVSLAGGAVTGGVLLTQRGETIEDLVKENLLPSEEEFTARLSIKKSDENPPKTTAKELKQWCEKTSKEFAEQSKVEEYKKWCTFTIKQKLNKALKTTNNDDSADWKIRARNLKDYEDTEEKIKDIKDKKQAIGNPEEDSEWQKLRGWCKDTYTENYQGENNNLWKLANKFCTKATIIDALHGTELLVNSDLTSEWTSKVTKAKVADSGLKDPSMNGKFDDSQANNHSKNLQDWCSTQYKKDHDSEETWGTKITVLSEVKKWCVLTVKDKLEETKTTKDNKGPIATENIETESKWTKNFKSLQDHSETTSEPIKLNDQLKTAKGTSTNGWQKLKDWCKFIYEKGYRGENNMDWKLADKFCRQND